jgi:hypothetical protein
MDSNCAESNVDDFFCCPGVWGLRDHRYNLLFISVIICSFIGLVGGGREKPAAHGGDLAGRAPRSGIGLAHLQNDAGFGCPGH